MNGTVIFIGIVLFFIISGLINFVGELQNDGKNNSVYSAKESSMNIEDYYDVNLIGEEIIILNGLSLSQKREIWKKSSLKKEMMNFFPDFSLMREFVEERIVDDGEFKKKLLEKIEKVEEEYIGGVMNSERAKGTLSSY